MKTSTTHRIRQAVQAIETAPAVPTILVPLLKLLDAADDRTRIEDVVRLVSYDNAIAAQCLRMASSPLFGLTKSPDSIKSAVISLGLRRVETILLTCCLGRAFPIKRKILDPTVFWRHSLGCAMVCQKFCQKLSCADGERAYMAGLLHDVGFMVNCIAFPEEFSRAVQCAISTQVPLDEAERSEMGFTHCETGRALAEKWRLGNDIIEVVAHHHTVELSDTAQALVALVHLSDLLCRMRGLGYGYPERTKVDLEFDPAWALLAKPHRDLDGIDLARFTFELDEDVDEIYQIVSAIFG